MVDIDKAYHLRAIEKDMGYTQAVKAGDFLFISGCVSWDQDGNPTNVGDMAGQLTAIYADIGKILKDHGLDPTDVVKETVYCTDYDKFAEVASIRTEFYGLQAGPAATGVEIKRLAHTDFLIEIEAIAYFNR